MYDVFYWKIGNMIIIIGLAIGSIYVFHEQKIGDSILGLLLPAIILFPLFYIHALGAGDIKLFSMIGYIYGRNFTISLITKALLFGAALSLIQIVRFGNLKIRMQYFFRYLFNCLKNHKTEIYYDEKKDGRKPVIHFSVAILLAYLYII